MSEPTARKYARLRLMPSAMKPPRTWRTRPDPYAEVWPEVESWLKLDAGLEAKTIWMALNERHAGWFSAGQLRRLQRRVHAWRTQSGPPKEVFFPQVYRPGEQGQSDFTDMRELAVTIAGEAFAHMLYPLRVDVLELGMGDDLPERELRFLECGTDLLHRELWICGAHGRSPISPLEQHRQLCSAQYDGA